MTRATFIPTPVKRIANVAAIALLTCSSLALLGAVPAKLAINAKSAVKQVAGPAAGIEQIAAIDADLAQRAVHIEPAELLQDIDDVVTADLDAEATVAAATIAAEPTGPRTTVMRMEVTAYCPCTKCCGPRAQGITASGKLVDHNGGKFVAADTRILPFGKKLSIPGYADNAPVEVIDRGGAIKGHKLDLYFPTHEAALVWGRQTLDVTVYE